MLSTQSYTKSTFLVRWQLQLFLKHREGQKTRSAFPRAVGRVSNSFALLSPRQVYRHIVLAVTTGNKMWGALGISRVTALAEKALIFNSLADLVLNYKHSYESVCHELSKVYVGLPFGKDAHSSSAPVKWRALKLSTTRSWAEMPSPKENPW